LNIVTLPDHDRQAKLERGAVPHVGIFWLVSDPERDMFVTDSVPISEAELYGDCLTHPRGHYEMWDRWQRAGPSWLKRNGLPTAICRTEYEEHPRGRIVYERSADLFVVYADRRLHITKTISMIVEAFRLPGDRSVVRSDDHYR
jgi:hypothetical protein